MVQVREMVLVREMVVQVREMVVQVREMVVQELRAGAGGKRRHSKSRWTPADVRMLMILLAMRADAPSARLAGAVTSTLLMRNKSAWQRAPEARRARARPASASASPPRQQRSSHQGSSPKILFPCHSYSTSILNE